MEILLCTLWCASLVSAAWLIADWAERRRARTWPKRIETPLGELMVFECGAALLRDAAGGLRVVMQGVKPLDGL